MPMGGLPQRRNVKEDDGESQRGTPIRISDEQASKVQTQGACRAGRMYHVDAEQLKEVCNNGDTKTDYEKENLREKP